MRRALRTSLMIAAAGCASFDANSPPTASIAVTGRLERTVTVQVQLIGNGQPVADAQFTVAPAAAATVVAPDSLRLLQAGPLTLSARGYAHGDSLHATLPLTVTSPPAIVFENVVSGNRDIYSAELDGTALAPVTTDPGDDRSPTARGGTIVFVSFRTGSAELFTVPLAGGTNVRLTTNSTSESDPALSPDGTHLAFVSAGAFPRVMTSDPSAVPATRPVAADAGFSGALEASPSWAPTNDRFAYMTTRDGSAGIYVAMLNGAAGSATQLVSGANGYANVEPAWNPNGLTVAFASNRDGPTDLYLVTLATGAVSRLTTRGNVGQPSWLRDGRLVFTEFVGGTFALRWLDPADTSAVHAIPTGPGSAQHPVAAQ